MARPSYGPEAKKRSLHLFTALLDYANDELDDDEKALEALRPQIQTHWQTEQRLVVRTKVRFLEALTKLAHTPLNAEQIKEALRRFEDFLEILDDNRPNKGGSEVWHFTLKLWHKRSDRPSNLQQFDREWECRRPQKSRQVAGSEGVGEWGSGGRGEGETEEEPMQVEIISPTHPPTLLPSPNWLELCREILTAQQCDRLTVNPLTINSGLAFGLHELYLPLGLVERKLQRAELSELDESEIYLSLEQFFDRLQSDEKKRVAIVGEPGAGKTTLLQKIATWLLEQQALPIWISLADLQGETLENYLLNDWLKQATRKISVPVAFQEALAEQFQQGRVWLLLDAIDEMALDATVALTNLARQLRGWIADANVVLTCRLNVWDNGKNVLLDCFTTYRNCSFSDEGKDNESQVEQFIDRWFQEQPQLGSGLRQALNDPKRKRVRQAVKNPLRLALLCRTWAITQGNLPHTKALLYQQFVETIYEWKQDRFPTAIAQRHQLNHVLGQVALRALMQPATRFRLSHSFTQRAFAESLVLMPLALQLGWLNQVGISTATGEKIYAFYHPTFQEYFAAQAISDWRFFFDPAHHFPVFSPQWREVILLWLGRTDIVAAEKEALIEALTHFEDGCGGFYSYRAYLLAAIGLAEFPTSFQAETILAQLVEWRFGPLVPYSLAEGARVALLQTDRTLAIATLEQFLQTAENPFVRWQAAYSLGKTLDPGSPVAIATLTQLIETSDNEALRLQVIESLEKVDPGNPLVLKFLYHILESTQQTSICRRAAYSLGKIQPGCTRAIAILEQLIHSTAHPTQQLRTAENLLAIDPENEIAKHTIQSMRKKTEKTSRKHLGKAAEHQTTDQFVKSLEQRLAVARDAANQRRIAYRLVTLQPGHPEAIACLLQLLQQRNLTLHKRIVEDLKEGLLDHQWADVVSQLSGLFANPDLPITQEHSPQLHECHKLLWYCAQQMPYLAFARTWR